MGVGVAEITSLQNKGVGKGLLASMPEPAFAAAETVVEVRLLKLVRAEGAEGVLELLRGHYITEKPLQLKGGQFIALLKPEVVVKEVLVEEGGAEHERQTKKTAVMEIDMQHLEERANLFAEEAEGRLRAVRDGGRLLPKVEAVRLLPDDVTRELVVREEKDLAVVTCLPCQKVRQCTEMKRGAMRYHAAGHLLLSQKPISGCGFCGVDLVEGGCVVEVTDGALFSNCYYQLSSFKYQRKHQEREEALAARLAVSEQDWAAATRDALKGKGAQVLNFPIKCPVQACGALIWKYNLIPHLLDTTKGVHPVPGGARCQAWRQRGKGLLLQLHGLISSSSSRVHGQRARGLKPAVVEEVADLLGEVRGFLGEQPKKEDGLRLAFCLEEIVAESKAAISSYHSQMGSIDSRKSASKTKKGGGRGSSTGEGTAGQACSAAAGDGDGGASGEEEEEEEEEEGEEEEIEDEEEEGEDEGEGRAGTSRGKRRSDGPEPGPASKRR